MNHEAPETMNPGGTSATYCPEDDKLRLYCGRVPRDEYERLRAEGWTSTPKQACDFVATWTPDRYRTAQRYAEAGQVDDEDQSPADRAADRADRFAGYLDKRTAEATGHADRYDAGPQTHGHQSYARAVRAADRHDRHADRATDAWSKAEYWQRRTEGVISHALYVSAPGVRMGRINRLESELRKAQADLKKRRERWTRWQQLAAMTDPEAQTAAAIRFTGSTSTGGHGFTHPRPADIAAALKDHPRGEHLTQHYSTYPTCLYSLLTNEHCPITGAEACTLYFARYSEPGGTTETTEHLELRLAYERQMLAAQGGRLEGAEIEAGGTFKGAVIAKVNKSAVTKRAKSIAVYVPRVDGYAYKVRNIGGKWAEMQIDLERESPEHYKAPTDESRAKLAEIRAELAALTADKPKGPQLINPTDEDAQKLQDRWNEAAAAENAKARKEFRTRQDFKPSPVLRMTQAQYTEHSGGTYSSLETTEILAGCVALSGSDHRQKGKGAVKVRTASASTAGEGYSYYSPRRVVIITDKPRKPFPADLWTAPETAEAVTA